MCDVAVSEETEVRKEIAKVTNRESIGGNILHFEVIEKKGNEEKRKNYIHCNVNHIFIYINFGREV